MWRNYLTVGRRALQRDPLFTIINLFGLAVGLAVGTIAGHALKVARANPIHALRYE